VKVENFLSEKQLLKVKAFGNQIQDLDVVFDSSSNNLLIGTKEVLSKMKRTPDRTLARSKNYNNCL